MILGYLIIVRLYKLYKAQLRKIFENKIQEDLVATLFSGLDPYSSELSDMVLVLKDRFFGDDEKTKLFINQLMDLSKSLDGETKKTLTYVFLKCDLLQFSEKKLMKGSWVERAMTIQILSQLQIEPAFDFIKQFTDYTKNDLIRQEAQIAAVRLGGGDCLDFVNELSTNLSEWQQLRILEELRRLDFPIVPNYKVWLNSENTSVVAFGLKLIGYFGHFEALVHFKDVFKNPNKEVQKELLLSIKKLQIPFHNQDILGFLKSKELIIPSIETLTVTCDEEQDELLPFLETDDYEIFKATVEFFKKNLPKVITELKERADLPEMKIAVLAHVNDERI